LIQHSGSGTVKDRQEKAHVHSVVLSPDQHYLYAADLGTDQETIYRFDPFKPLPLSAAADSFVKVSPGSGPRHLVFHPKKPYAYLIEELSGTVDVFRYNHGMLKPIQRISTHPSDFTGQKGSADIHITADGRFLYASNRGDANSIAIFSIDTATGKLKNRGFQSVMGKTPRNFIIDPTGHYLLVANQQSDNIVLFKIDRQTGLLKPTGDQIQVPNPVCLKMLKK
jgi:6-phosphogluconolactonase